MFSSAGFVKLKLPVITVSPVNYHYLVVGYGVFIVYGATVSAMDSRGRRALHLSRPSSAHDEYTVSLGKIKWRRIKKTPFRRKLVQEYHEWEDQAILPVLKLYLSTVR